MAAETTVTRVDPRTTVDCDWGDLGVMVLCFGARLGKVKKT